MNIVQVSRMFAVQYGPDLFSQDFFQRHGRHGRFLQGNAVRVKDRPRRELRQDVLAQTHVEPQAVDPSVGLHVLDFEFETFVRSRVGHGFRELHAKSPRVVFEKIVKVGRNIFQARKVQIFREPKVCIVCFFDRRASLEHHGTDFRKTRHGAEKARQGVVFFQRLHRHALLSRQSFEFGPVQ